MRALYALLADTLLDLRGIFTVEGSASAGRGFDNLAGLLESLRREGIPAFRGRSSTDFSPPPWRETAEGLGGAPFDPPRLISAPEDSHDRLLRLIEDNRPELDCIALGPLGNLCALEKSHPGALEKLRSIWIPVTAGPGARIRSWNLSCDWRSTAAVFGGARCIVLIDLAPADTIGTRAFAHLRDDTKAAAWINRVTAQQGDGGPHLRPGDDLAAAALVEPGLLELDEENYELKMEETGEMRIAAAPDGNVRIARFAEPETAVRQLRELWQRPATGDAHREPPEEIPAEKLLTSLHGHLGPYVVLGYRMGRLALEASGSGGHFDISAVVHCKLDPPVSCLIDGIQLGSGCTLGKRNIRAVEFEGAPYAVFETKLGEKVTVKLLEGIPELVGRLIEEAGIEAAGRRLLEMDAGDLFDILTGPAAHDGRL